MTIAEAINSVDRLKPNRYSLETKIEWLDQIEQQIYQEIILTHENPMMIMMPVINQDSDPDTRLIAMQPYDDVYKFYLMCQIDLGNMEIGKYNNDRTLFNNALMTFRDYWNRTFMPCERAHCFSFDDRRRHPPVPYDGHKIFSKGNPLDMRERPVPIKPAPMKTVQEEIAQIHAVDRMQQKDIEKLKRSGAAGIESMSAAEVGDIIG